MKDQIKLSIIDTLAYFDVFGYCLTFDQVVSLLHSQKVEKRLIKECIDVISIIEKKGGYYFFSGRTKSALNRKIKQNYNKEKINLAKNYASLLGFIPGVKFIALTGSVSMMNASENDDIDLFIVTKNNMLWIARFYVVLLVKFLGVKREYRNKVVRDKLCLNMFLDEDEMSFSDRNIYIAHEIAQMKVLYDDGDMYGKLIHENIWIKRFFPNMKINYNNSGIYKKRINARFVKSSILNKVNFLFFIFQYKYMKNKITQEKVNLKKAFFHPNDNAHIITVEYKKRRDYYINLYKKADNSKYSVTEEANLKLVNLIN